MDVNSEPDAGKLASLSTDKQRLVLFQRLCTLEKDLKRCSEDILKPIQPKIEKQLLDLVSEDPPPVISRRIGHCFGLLFERGEQVNLLSATSQCIDILKSRAGPLSKLAAAYCITAAWRIHNASIHGTLSEIITQFVKHIRSNEVLLRVDLTTCLSSMIMHSQGLLSEPLFRDILKMLKLHLVDRHTPFRSATSQCLCAMIRGYPYLFTSHEVESIVQTALRQFDTVDHYARRDLVSLIVHALGLTQDTVLPRSVSIERHDSEKSLEIVKHDTFATHTTVHLQLPLRTVLSWLSAPLIKTAGYPSSKKQRLGILECYARFFASQSSGFMDRHLVILIQHLLQDWYGQSRLVSATQHNVAEEAYFREMAITCLKQAFSCCSETGHVLAVNELVSLLSGWSNTLPKETGDAPTSPPLPCQQTLALYWLADLCALLQSLLVPGDHVIDTLIKYLYSDSLEVHLSLAWCLQAIVSAQPSLLPVLLLRTLQVFEKHRDRLGALDVQLAQADRRTSAALRQEIAAFSDTVQGSAYVLAALLTCGVDHPLFLPNDLPQRLWQMAMTMLNHLAKETSVAQVQLQCLWTLISACVTFGPSLMQHHVETLVSLWRNVFMTSIERNSDSGQILGFQSLSKSEKMDMDWPFYLCTRECALNALYVFQRTCSAMAVEHAAFIANALSGCLIFLENMPSSVAYPHRHRYRQRVYDCLCLQDMSIYENPDVSFPNNVLREFANVHMEVACTPLLRMLLDDRDLVLCDWSGDADDPLHNDAVGMLSYDPLSLIVRRPAWIALHRESITDQNATAHPSPPLESHLLSCSSTSTSSPSTSTPSSKMIQKTYRLNEVEIRARPRPLSPELAGILSAIRFFGMTFPRYAVDDQVYFLQEFVRLLKEVRLSRKYALSVNIFAALLYALVCMAQQSRAIVDDRLFVLLQEIAQGVFLSAATDPVLRIAAAETLGRLASVTAVDLHTWQLRKWVDATVQERESVPKAGFAVSLGCVYRHLGGVATVQELKGVVAALQSLSVDATPLVSQWALHALWCVMEATGALFSPHLSGTLALVVQLYLSPYVNDGHPALHELLARLLSVTVSTLGADLLSAVKLRDVCLDLMVDLARRHDVMRTGAVIGEAILCEQLSCSQSLLLMAPSLVDVSLSLEQVTLALRMTHRSAMTTHSDRLLHRALEYVVHLLWKYDALQTTTNTGLLNGVCVALFALLDHLMVREGSSAAVCAVMSLIHQMIQFSAHHDVLQQCEGWIARCSDIVIRTYEEQRMQVDASFGNGTTASTMNDKDNDHNHDDDDEEEDEEENVMETRQGTMEEMDATIQDDIVLQHCERRMRWRSKLIGMSCLHGLLFQLASPSLDQNPIQRRRPPRGSLSLSETAVLSTVSSRGSLSSPLPSLVNAVEDDPFNDPVAPLAHTQESFSLSSSSSSSSSSAEKLAFPALPMPSLTIIDVLMARLPDLIRVAFSAATSVIEPLRISGLVFLQRIIHIFAGVTDPSVPGTLLLEQYQALINAALGPAFGQDASPLVVNEGCRGCAMYLKAAAPHSDLTRIVKMLNQSLDILYKDLKWANMSPNVYGCMKVSILQAWADLALHAAGRPHVEDLVLHARPMLQVLWMTALQEFAELKFANTTGMTEAAATQLSLSRNAMLPYYEHAWSTWLEAMVHLTNDNALYATDELIGPLEYKILYALSLYGLENDKAQMCLYLSLFQSLYHPNMLSHPDKEMSTDLLTRLRHIVKNTVDADCYLQVIGVYKVMLAHQELTKTEYTVLMTQTLVIMSVCDEVREQTLQCLASLLEFENASDIFVVFEEILYAVVDSKKDLLALKAGLSTAALAVEKHAKLIQPWQKFMDFFLDKTRIDRTRQLVFMTPPTLMNTRQLSNLRDELLLVFSTQRKELLEDLCRAETSMMLYLGGTLIPHLMAIGEIDREITHFVDKWYFITREENKASILSLILPWMVKGERTDYLQRALTSIIEASPNAFAYYMNHIKDEKRNELLITLCDILNENESEDADSPGHSKAWAPFADNTDRFANVMTRRPSQSLLPKIELKSNFDHFVTEKET